MKKLLIFSVILLLTLFRGYSQSCRYELVYNPVSDLFEAHMHVITAYTDPMDAYVGPSAFSVVFPSDIADVSIQPASVISVNPQKAVWADNSPVFAPESASKYDFHKFTTMGAAFNPGTDLSAGSDIVLFTFPLPQNDRTREIRVFSNWGWASERFEPDPDSSAKGMEGGDFRNSFQTLKTGETYIGVMKNSVTGLGATRDAFRLVLWPNPTRGPVHVDLKWGRIREVEVKVSNVLGEEIFRKEYQAGNVINFDLSGHVSGAYMVEIVVDGVSNLYKVVLDRK